jgi:hypothetical protein
VIKREELCDKDTDIGVVLQTGCTDEVGRKEGRKEGKKERREI